MTLIACRVYATADGRAWVQPPTTARVDSAGNVIRGADGWPIRDRVVSFGGRAAETAWSDSVIEVLRAEQPGSLA
jgi:hypothetical protein